MILELSCKPVTTDFGYLNCSHSLKKSNVWKVTGGKSSRFVASYMWINVMQEVLIL